MCKYRGLLNEEEAESIEKIIGYRFKNKGLIEKAVIHPSSHSNVLGSVHFNKLELVGDCMLDVLVTEKIYEEHKEMGPSGLHFVRKSMVNNYTYARALFSMGLEKHIHTCFSREYLKDVESKLCTDGEKVSKVFGDIFEAIAGSVSVDSLFDLHICRVFFHENIYNVLMKCADTSR